LGSDRKGITGARVIDSALSICFRGELLIIKIVFGANRKNKAENFMPSKEKSGKNSYNYMNDYPKKIVTVYNKIYRL